MSKTGLRPGCFDPYNAPGHFSKMPEWLELSPEVSLAARCVYARLVQHWGDVTEKRPVQKAYAGIDTLSVELAISPSKVKRAIAELEGHKLLLVSRRPTRNNRYFFLVHEWQKRTAKNVTGVGVSSLVRQRKDGRIGPPVRQQKSTRRLLASAGGPYKETPLEETPLNETRKGDPSSGERCSPENVSLRSTFPDGSSVTKECFATDEGLSQELNYAADSVALPQPPVPEIVSQLAPEFVVGDPLMEDGMSDEERKRRMESARRQAQMAEHTHDVQKAKNAARDRERAERAAAAGMPKAVKIPKSSWVSVVTQLQKLWIAEYRKKFPDSTVASEWTPQQGVRARELIKRYPVIDIEQAIRYYLRYWEMHQPRFFKGKEQVPTLGAFCTLHETLLPESQNMFPALKAKTDYQEWCKQNPDAARAPADLEAAYDAARPMLKTLGM